MGNETLDNIYKIDSYCKSEGLNSEYFMYTQNASSRRRKTGRRGIGRKLTAHLQALLLVLK